MDIDTPEETQLSAELRHMVQGGLSTPDLDAIERRVRRDRQRAFALRGLASLGVVGIAVAGTLVAFRHPGTTAGTPVAGKPAATKATSGQKTTAAVPQVENLAYVRQQLGAAHDPPSSVVEASERQSGTSPEVVWTDPATGHKMRLEGGGSGKVTLWQHDYVASNNVLHYDSVQANYGPRTWFNLDTHDPAPLGAPVAKNYGGDYFPAANVKDLLGEGAAKIVGHPVVDGRHTVELSVAIGTGFKFVFYVDSQTFQVVRSLRYYPSSTNPVIDDYTWVKRTSAQTKLINNPRIPAGFTQVAPPQ
jgi:hypothetical protein